MDNNEFRHWSVKAAEWGVDYRTGLRDRPVRPDVKPGSIFGAVAANAPEQAEPMADIFADFEATIVPGMTHWQHPRFFAYFPGQRCARVGGGGIFGQRHGCPVHALANLAGGDRAREPRGGLDAPCAWPA